PEPQKGLAFELAVEQRAYPGAGEPDRVPVRRFEGKDEGVTEGAANRARFDLRPLGRYASATLLLPIGIEFAARRVFHEIGSRPSCGCGRRCPRTGQVRAGLAAWRRVEQGACRTRPPGAGGQRGARLILMKH